MWCTNTAVDHRLRPFAFPLIFLACAIGILPSAKSLAQDRASDEEKVRLAVIRKQMQDWYRDGDKNEAEAKDADDKLIAKRLNFRLFFVSIKGRDPSDGFLAKLRDIPRTIKKVSESKIIESTGPVVDRHTHERGIIFSADSIRWLNEDTAEVEGGYHCDGLCGAIESFTVHREDGKWVVKSSRINVISELPAKNARAVA